MMQDRRKDERIPSAVEILFSTAGALKSAYTKDISKGGLFFEANRELELNSEFAFHIQVKNLPGLVFLTGRVVHVQQLSDSRYGVGVQFSDLNSQEQSQLQSLVQKAKADSLETETPKARFIFTKSASSQAPTTRSKPDTNQSIASDTAEFDFEEDIVRLEKRIATKNCYKMLLAKDDADEKSLRRAYHAFCNDYHPDLYKGAVDKHWLERLEDAFNKVTNAYKALKSPEKRKAIDKELTIKGSSILNKHQKQRENYEKQNPDKTKQAARLYEMALDLADADGSKKAIMNLKLAISLNPYNPDFKTLLKKLESS